KKIKGFPLHGLEKWRSASRIRTYSARSAPACKRFFDSAPLTTFYFFTGCILYEQILYKSNN
ncbi:MAG: hypothetical protein K6E51_14420, partial [Treponema sp.]|nr:hypothetical protein [Treponema sp.]